MIKEPIQQKFVISPTSPDYNTNDGSVTGFYKSEQLTNNRNRACISVTAQRQTPKIKVCQKSKEFTILSTIMNKMQKVKVREAVTLHSEDGSKASLGHNLKQMESHKSSNMMLDSHKELEEKKDGRFFMKIRDPQAEKF